MTATPPPRDPAGGGADQLALSRHRRQRRWIIGAAALGLLGVVGAVKGPRVFDRFVTGRRHRLAIDPTLLPPAIADLPVVLAGPSGDAKAVVVFVSGDGGWQIIDRKITGPLARSGYLMAGLDSIAYFDQHRTPDELAVDVARIFAALRPSPDTPLVLMGYSFGADVLPFIATRLPPDEKAHLARTVFLGLSRTANFWLDFGRLVQWAGIAEADTLPEIARMGDSPKTCIYGSHEENTPCATLQAPALEKIELPGDHHFDHDSPLVIETLRGVLDRTLAARR